MLKEFYALSFGFAALILLQAQTVHSQPAGQIPCGARAEILAQLADRYHETRRAIGLAANNTLLEIFASEDSGSFTILATVPGGPTCLIAAGENFEAVADRLQLSGKST